MDETNTDDGLRRILETSHTFAILGANPKPDRPAHYVPVYLKEHGYEVLPVNPVHAGKEMFGHEVVATLPELGIPIDVVDVFRRPDALPAHLDEILAMKPLPKVVWLQLGIRNDAFAQKLLDAGIEVVQDHCALAEHRRLM